MATKTFKVSLSLDNPRIIQSGINVHSFDKQSIKITIELTKNSQVYQIPADAQIKISLLKLARQEQKIILDVPFTSADSIDWIVPDYLDGYHGEVRVGVYLIVGTENIDVGYFNITSSVSDIDSAAEEFTESVLQGWAIEDLTALLPKFQEVIDETTGKDVISAPEIILARGGATTLGERLDSDKAEVTAQLAQTEAEIENVKTVKSDKVYVDNELNKRAKITEVRENTYDRPINVSEMDTETKQLFTGGNVAVVGEKAVGRENIKPRAVAPENTNFINVSSNLIDVSDFEPTREFNMSGQLIFNANKVVLPYIPVKEGQPYAINVTGKRAFYTYNFNLISVHDNLTTVTTPPLNAGYVRFDATYDELASLQMNEGETLLPYEEYYVESFGLSFEKTEVINSDKVFISDNIKKSRNICDGTYLNANLQNTGTEGNVGTLDTTSTDGAVYIVEVNPNKMYTISKSESNIFRVAFSKIKPINGTGVSVVKGSENDINSETTVTTFNSTKYMLLYLAWGEPAPAFVQVEEGETKTEWETPGYKFSHLSKPFAEIQNGLPVPTERALSTFVEEMNQKAEWLGMTNTNFIEPSGTNLNNKSTAMDIIKLALHSIGYDYLMKIWNKTSHTVNVEGSNPRQVTIETTVIKPELDDFYHIFGGKSGTGVGQFNLVSIVESGDKKGWFIGVVLGQGTNTNRHQVSKQLYDIATRLLREDSIDGFVFQGEIGAVILVPPHNPLSYVRYDLPLIHSVGDVDEVKYIASITKLMTVLVALDYITDFDEKVEIIESDGVNPADAGVFPAGDIVTIQDLIYGAMLPSSNTFATALGRIIGEKIIRKRLL